MRKVILLGVVLTGFIYALPFVSGEMEIPYQDAMAQDSRSDDAESTVTAQGSGTSIMVQIDGTPQQMELEDYVAGVVAAEVPPTFPPEALKAQAVAARTYAAYKLASGRPEAHREADVCDDYHHCAAYIDLAAEASGRWGNGAETYQNAILEAVRSTAGEIVLYEDKPIIAVFSAAAAEKTESSADVWGNDVPYLQTVDSPGGEACPKYKGEAHFTAEEFRAIMAKALPAAKLDGTPDTWFTASERSAAGGIKTATVGGVKVSGTDLRQAFGLNSTNFTLRADKDSITFLTTGYGHGVGLSQYGAKYMAEQGKTYQEILTHYYTGTSIKPLSSATNS
jgi:stage II sporulation protein D